MPWIDAFIPAEIKYRNQVLADTWGHLAPRKNKTYPGRIVYAVGCFGDDELNPTAIACEFAGLDSSPWFFEALSDFIGEQGGESGRVYEFAGTFRNYEFKGSIRCLLDANASPQAAAPARQGPQRRETAPAE